jgi:hypothetical protein
MKEGVVMNNKLVNGLIKCGLLIAMIAVMVGQPAKAQSLVYGLRANIPFDFKVGDKTFSAGKYTVNRVQQDDVVLKISSLDGKANTFRGTVSVHVAKTRNRGVLVFHRYGDQYYLAQVWAAGASIGRELPVSRSERDLKNQQGDTVGQAAKQEMEVVAIAADMQ